MQRAILEPLALVTQLVFGAVLERFPRLQVVLAEYDLCWLHPFISKMDVSLRKGESQTRNAAKFSALPSEYIKRQVYATIGLKTSVSSLDRTRSFPSFLALVTISSRFIAKL